MSKLNQGEVKKELLPSSLPVLKLQQIKAKYFLEVLLFEDVQRVGFRNLLRNRMGS